MGIGVLRKSLYKAKETPSLLTVPSVPYLVIDGEGIQMKMSTLLPPSCYFPCIIFSVNEQE